MSIGLECPVGVLAVPLTGCVTLGTDLPSLSVLCGISILGGFVVWRR